MDRGRPCYRGPDSFDCLPGFRYHRLVADCGRRHHSCGIFVLFAIEMRQDFGKVPYYQKHLRETIPYDPEKEEAVIRYSICTGEKVAGFRNRENGHFKEVMVLRTPEDEEQFFHIYGIRNVKKEY